MSPLEKIKEIKRRKQKLDMEKNAMRAMLVSTVLMAPLGTAQANSFSEKQSAATFETNIEYAQEIAGKIKTLVTNPNTQDKGSLKETNQGTEWTYNNVKMTEKSDTIYFSAQDVYHNDLDIVVISNSKNSEESIQLIQNGEKVTDSQYLTPGALYAELYQFQQKGRINKDYNTLKNDQNFEATYLKHVTDEFKKKTDVVFEEADEKSWDRRTTQSTLWESDGVGSVDLTTSGAFPLLHYDRETGVFSSLEHDEYKPLKHREVVEFLGNFAKNNQISQMTKTQTKDNIKGIQR